MFVSAKTTNEDIYLSQKFARIVLGTNNIDHCARLCHVTTAIGLAQNLGAGVMTNSIEDIPLADVLLIIGTNPASQHPLVWQGITKQRKKNNKPFIIVIDPRKTKIVENADMFLQIHPGTDTTLLNGIMKVIYDLKLEDEEFIKENTKILSYVELIKVLHLIDLDEVARICGVTVDQIREVAITYGEAKSAAIIWGNGNNPTYQWCCQCVSIIQFGHVNR